MNEAPAAKAWRNGGVVRAGEGDAPGPGCYTTALWTEGAVRFEIPVAERLCCEAAALGYGALDALECIRGMRALGRAAFGTGRGVLRFEARAGAAGVAGTGAARATGAATLIGSTRPYQAPPAQPETARAAQRHPGPLLRPAFGAKVPRRELAQARAECSARGLQEVLLFDAAGRLVEGSRSNVVVASPGGEWLFPEPALGAVRGVALGIACTRLPELRAAELGPRDLEHAREIVLLNAVIGAQAQARYEGRPLGVPASRPGPVRLHPPKAAGQESQDGRGPLARALEAALRAGG